MKIFLDVGGHYGETLGEILKPRWRFDAVHCFEPQAQCYAYLQSKFSDQIATNKLALHNYGLADFDGERDLFGGSTRSIAASLFADKNDINNIETEKCKFIRASTFVQRHIRRMDFTLMKLNCEGGEVLILRDLMQSGAIHLLNSIYIDFDIRKIPSQRSEEPKLLAELRNCNFNNFVLAHEVARVKTFSLSRKRMVDRTIMSYPSSPAWPWLIQLSEVKLIRHLSVTDKMIRVVITILPKFIWGRLFRIKRIINRLRHKNRNRDS